MFIFFNLINMRKNLFKCLVIVPVMFWLILWVCFWQLRGLRWWDGWSDAELDSKNPYTDPSVDTLVCDGYTDLWNCTSVKERNDTIIVRLLKVFGLNDSIEKERDLKFIDYYDVFYWKWSLSKKSKRKFSWNFYCFRYHMISLVNCKLHLLVVSIKLAK